MASPTGRQGQSATGSYRGPTTPAGYSYGELPQFTGQQMNLFRNMFQGLGQRGFMSKLARGNEAAFQQMEAPAYRDFNTQMGNIASRFSGQGDLGSRRSSGFQNATTSAASNFTQDLQSRRIDLQRQAMKDLFDLRSQLLGQRPYEKYLLEKPESNSNKLIQALVAGLSGGLGGAASGGNWLSGLLGAFGGFGNLFK